MKIKKSYVIYLLVFFCLFSVSAFGKTILKIEFQNTQPKYFLDKSGAGSGLIVELMNEIERHANVEFTYPKKYIPAKRLQRNLELGNTDVHLGLARNAKREKIYIFGEPLYTVKHLVAVNKGDTVNVKTFDDIRVLRKDGVLLTPTGTGTYRYIFKQGGLQIDDGADNLSKNFEKLTRKRGRFVYYHSLGLLHELNKPQFKGKFKVLPASFREYEHWIVFSKKLEPGIIKKVNSAIKDSKKGGDWSRIVDKYLRVK